MFDDRDGFEPESAAAQEGAPGPRAAGEWNAADSSTRERLPAGTGVAALGVLDEFDLTGLSGNDLLDVLTAWERQASWVAARGIEVLAAASARLLSERSAELGGRPDYPLMISEIAGATRQSEAWVGQRWETAERLTGLLTETLASLREGKISEFHARQISDETRLLEPEDALRVEAAVLPKAGDRTPAAVRRSLRRAVNRVDPSAADRRARRAVKDRSVWTRPLPDGMAELNATGPAAAIQAIFGVLDRRAASPREEGDTRLIDARRFDALLMAVTGAGAPAAGFPGPAGARTPGGPGAPGAPGGPAGPPPPGVTPDDVVLPDGIAPEVGGLPDYVPMGPGFLGDGGPPVAAIVHVTMDLPTLLGLREEPARLEGYGPLPAALARDLAAGNSWRRLVTEPMSGALLDAGRRSYRPSAPLADFIRARDQTCIFLGCSQSSWKANLDHQTRFSLGGTTDRAHLGSLCPRHHRLRHRGWSYRFVINGRDTVSGELEDPAAAADLCDVEAIIWTSPAGRTYTTYPDRDMGPPSPPRDLHPHERDDWLGDGPERPTDLD